MRATSDSSAPGGSFGDAQDLSKSLTCLQLDKNSSTSGVAGQWIFTKTKRIGLSHAEYDNIIRDLFTHSYADHDNAVALSEGELAALKAFHLEIDLHALLDQIKSDKTPFESSIIRKRSKTRPIWPRTLPNDNVTSTPQIQGSQNVADIFSKSDKINTPQFRGRGPAAIYRESPNRTAPEESSESEAEALGDQTTPIKRKPARDRDSRVASSSESSAPPPRRSESPLPALAHDSWKAWSTTSIKPAQSTSSETSASQATPSRVSQTAKTDDCPETGVPPLAHNSWSSWRSGIDVDRMTSSVPSPGTSQSAAGVAKTMSSLGEPPIEASRAPVPETALDATATITKSATRAKESAVNAKTSRVDLPKSSLMTGETPCKASIIPASTPAPTTQESALLSTGKTTHGRGRKLFSVQIDEDGVRHDFQVCERDDPYLIARELEIKFRKTVKLTEEWKQAFLQLYQKKMARLNRAHPPQ